ncbi:hypothetical protein Tco_1052309 [Tanacetum coccineum]
MSRRSSSHADDSASESRRTLNYSSSCGAKEFFGTEGAVGLLTWFKSTYLVQTRGRASAIAQPWEDFKELLMEEYCPDDEIQKLELEF